MLRIKIKQKPHTSKPKQNFVVKGHLLQLIIRAKNS